jgi:hypothetical protein
VNDRRARWARKPLNVQRRVRTQGPE